MRLHYDVQFYAAVIMAILFYAVRKNSSKRMSAYYFGYMVLCTFFFLIFDGLECYLLMRGNLHVPTIKILDFFSYGFSILNICYFYFYMVAFLREYKGAKIRPCKNYIFWSTVFILVVYLLAVIFNWYYVVENDRITYNTRYLISQADAYLLHIPEFILLFKYRKYLRASTFRAWMLWLFLPLLCQIVGLMTTSDYLQLSTACVTVFLYISVNQETELMLHMKNVAFRQQELEVQKSRQKVIMSQIQPHFLYNVLNTICILCRKNPELAAKTTSNFATYLRMNLNSVDQNEPVNFNEEMKHTQIYLELEKLRFGEALNIEYNINTTSFYLPVLSLQPIVENAVKHGICMKEEDGTLRISTYEKADAYEIVVVDDGVGFDVAAVSRDGESHLGIQNTKKRIEAMCSGTLTIESVVGKGTTVTIRLPKSINSSFKAVATVNSSIVL
ncbi:MAG: histidine kinase [Spirochaetales bacterium]|nr:histidine kinase [Candidatus Physcosoma equi]